MLYEVITARNGHDPGGEQRVERAPAEQPPRQEPEREHGADLDERGEAHARAESEQLGDAELP